MAKRPINSKKPSSKDLPPVHREPVIDYTDAIWVTPVGVRGVILKNKWITTYGAAYQHLQELTGKKDMTQEYFNNYLKGLPRIQTPLQLYKHLTKVLKLFINAQDLGRLMTQGDPDWKNVQL